MFTPSVQFTNLYPAFVVGVTVAEALVSNVPPPLVVPPVAGIDDNATVYVGVILKLHT